MVYYGKDVDDRIDTFEIRKAARQSVICLENAVIRANYLLPGAMCADCRDARSTESQAHSDPVDQLKQSLSTNIVETGTFGGGRRI